MAAAHAAADGEVVADELPALDNADEAEVVGEDVHVVHRRQDEGGLEFARQVGLAVERVHEILVRRVVEVELHAVNPDGVIGLRLRRERGDHAMHIGDHRGAGVVLRGRGRSHDVAVHVAASRERGEETVVDFLN